MDPVSQAALGAAWAQPAARPGQVVAATIAGFVSGMAPDLDILIRSSRDPLLALEIHRHFTHSLAFVPLGAWLCSLLLYPLLRSTLSRLQCYGFCLLGFASHGLLDACTSYGTLLLWPFSNERVAWDLISVVDPLFTGPLIVLVTIGVIRRKIVFAAAGIGWSLVYLSLGWVQHERALAFATELARDREHGPVSRTVKPTLGNLVLWKSIYEYEGRFYIDAIRVGFSATVFEGESKQKLDLPRDFPWLVASTEQYRDVERFSHFANGFLSVDRSRPKRIVDIRYSLVPTRGDGFWAIELDPGADPAGHVAYVTMRNRSTSEGGEFLRMLFR